jgi:hypothetical protein
MGDPHISHASACGPLLNVQTAHAFSAAGVAARAGAHEQSAPAPRARVAVYLAPLSPGAQPGPLPRAEAAAAAARRAQRARRPRCCTGPT